MDPLLHIVSSGRRWEVTLRLFLTRSKFILSTPSYCLKPMKSPQIKASSLPSMCPNHWAEDSALLGSNPELLHDFCRIWGESPVQSPVVEAPSEEVRDMGLNWWVHTLCFLSRAHWLLDCDMRSRQRCHRQISHSAGVLKGRGHSQVWAPSPRWVSVLVAVLPPGWEVASLPGSTFQSEGGFGQVCGAGGYPGQALGHTGSNGRWREGTGIAGSGADGEGKHFLDIVLHSIFSKCWDANATWHYESCCILCPETTNAFDSHHIHQLVEQIYPPFLNLSEWDFTCG